jgi:predicted DNA-binding transcriptional regulator YafY
MPDLICDAIKNRNVIQFNYTGDKAVGMRTVEPHQIGYSKAGNLTLSAWFLSGASESSTGQGFRLYLLSEINGLNVLEQRFDGARPDYKPGPNKILRKIQCEL